jgi:hypothetical protein
MATATFADTTSDAMTHTQRNGLPHGVLFFRRVRDCGGSSQRMNGKASSTALGRRHPSSDDMVVSEPRQFENPILVPRLIKFPLQPGGAHNDSSSRTGTQHLTRMTGHVSLPLSSSYCCINPIKDTFVPS